MEKEFFGFKELFDVQLRATQEIIIGSRVIEKGEPIAVFQSIQYGNIEETKDYTAATGGHGNPPLITWESTREVRLYFTQGIFSKIHLALLGNSNLFPTKNIIVPMIEEGSTDEEGAIELKYPPLSNHIFIYDAEGNKIKNYTIIDKKIYLPEHLFKNIKIIYDFNYDNDATILEVGKHWLSGFMELRGKTRLKDDKTGQTITGIISIPKIKLMSDLSIRLGSSAPPVAGNFHTIAFPVGAKGNQRVMDFILLSDDVDSDL